MGLAKLVSFSQLVLCFLFFMGCSHVTCRGDVDKPKQSDSKKEGMSSSGGGPSSAPLSGAGSVVSAPGSSNENPTTTRVTVYKADGSLQCGMGEAVSLTVMQKELGTIKVFNSYKRSDGLMRIQLCGSPTGNCNFYEIEQKDLTAALNAGFQEWKK